MTSPRLGSAPNMRPEPVGTEGDRVIRVAVGIFRHEDIIADQQGRDHRSRRDVERLKQQRAYNERDGERLDETLIVSNNPPSSLGLVGLACRHRRSWAAGEPRRRAARWERSAPGGR